MKPRTIVVEFLKREDGHHLLNVHVDFTQKAQLIIDPDSDRSTITLEFEEGDFGSVVSPFYEQTPSRSEKGVGPDSRT